MQGFNLRNKFLNIINIVWLPAAGVQGRKIMGNEVG